MGSKSFLVIIACGLCAAVLVSPAFAVERVSTIEKGSLLIYPKVEIQWWLDPNGMWQLTQDTFIDISNDYPAGVNVQMYFVNGDPQMPEYNGKCVAGFCDANSPPYLIGTACNANFQCYERAHLGSCGWVDVGIHLSADEPAYWSAYSGLPGPDGGVSPFTILDPGNPPGRPNPDGSGTRILRGFVLAWAVDAEGEQIRWNHLKGDAVLVNYGKATAWEYNAYAFQVHSVLHGQLVHPGLLPEDPAEFNLDGTEYDSCHGQLLLDFYTPGSYALTSQSCHSDKLGDCANMVQVFTDLTLMPALIDLRQDGDGPATTKAKFVICDENEVCLTNTTRCITCWDQEWLHRYDPPNHFINMQTDKGKARIDGIASSVCDDAANGVVSVDAPLLGVVMKELVFTNNSASPAGQAYGTGAMTLVGFNEEAGHILADREPWDDDDEKSVRTGTCGGGKTDRTAH